MSWFQMIGLVVIAANIGMAVLILIAVGADWITRKWPDADWY